MRKREEYGEYLATIFPGETPNCSGDKPPLLDYRVSMETGEWGLWRDEVPVLDVEPHQVFFKTHSDTFVFLLTYFLCRSVLLILSSPLSILPVMSKFWALGSLIVVLSSSVVLPVLVNP